MFSAVRYFQRVNILTVHPFSGNFVGHLFGQPDQGWARCRHQLPQVSL